MQDFNYKEIIKYDNFLKSKFITFQSIKEQGSNFPDFSFGDCIICPFDNQTDSLKFTFRFYDNKTYLILKFDPSEYKLKINDSVTFLFEDEIILNYILSNEPYKAGVYVKRSSNNILTPAFFETLIPISLKGLEIFSQKKLINYALNLKNYKLIGGISDSKTFKDKVSFQNTIKIFALTFINLIKKEVPDYIELQERHSADACYVYLMQDTLTNLYKIGISNKPEYREKTLQSEKPSIVLTTNKRFPNRKIAEVLEKTLHETYSNKRIRGEWFKLDLKDIQDISSILKD